MFRIPAGLIAVLMLSVPGHALAAQKQPEPVRILVGRFLDATPLSAADSDRQEKNKSAKGDQEKQADLEFSGRKVSLEFENADLRDVLELLTEVLDPQIGLSEDVQGMISIQAVDMPVDLVMAMIIERAGLDIAAGSGGRVVRLGDGYAGKLDGLIRVKGEKPASREEIMQRYRAMLSVNTRAVTWIGKAVQGSLTSALMSISGYDVVNEPGCDVRLAGSAAAEQGKQPPLSECGQVLGGTYRIEGGVITLDLEAVSASSGAVLFNKTWSGETKNLPGMLPRIVLEMASASKVSVNDGESRRVLARKTASVEAWRLNSEQLRVADFSRYKSRKWGLAETNTEKALLEAVRLDPDYAEAWKGLGLLYHAKSNSEKAAKAFEKALQLEPDFFEALVGMGRVLEGEDHEKALSYYRKAAKLNPSHHQNTLHLFKLLAKLEKHDEAADAARILLRDKSGRDGREVVEGLGKLHGRTAIFALIEALEHWDAVVRERAVVGLRWMRYEKPELRAEADEGLWIKSFQTAVPLLTGLLADTSISMRREAAATLGALGDRSAVKPLLGALRDADTSVRQEAVGALGNLADAAAVPDLLSALTDTEPGVRFRAAAALAKMGDASAQALLLNVLQEALRDADEENRASAAEALGTIADKAAVPALIRALKDSSNMVRWRSADALGRIGDGSALPALRKALKDKDPMARAMAANALGAMKDEASRGKLSSMLKDADSSVRQAAAWALREMGVLRKSRSDDQTRLRVQE